MSLKQVDAEKLEQPPTDIPLITNEKYEEMYDKINPFKH